MRVDWALELEERLDDCSASSFRLASFAASHWAFMVACSEDWRVLAGALGIVRRGEEMDGLIATCVGRPWICRRRL